MEIRRKPLKPRLRRIRTLLNPGGYWLCWLPDLRADNYGCKIGEGFTPQSAYKNWKQVNSL